MGAHGGWGAWGWGLTAGWGHGDGGAVGRLEGMRADGGVGAWGRGDMGRVG